MRFISMTRFGLLAFVAILLFSCKKKTEIFQTDNLSDYTPMTVGKYITYRLDSTVFTNFGRSTEIHSYQIKHVVESQITDNLGRPSYRIFRYLRDTAGTQSWTPAGSYFITPLSNQVEAVEDNLRFIKLHAPIVNDFTWKGNKYLNSDPYSSLYSFTNDDEMDNWDYHYESINDNFRYNQQTLTDVINVIQIDEKFALDTADVIGNKATIPANSDATYIRGSATDTIIINAGKPASGHEDLTIYNRSNFYASLNKIIIPPNLALSFEYANDKWYYPNMLNVSSNGGIVSIPPGIFLAYIFGTAATGNIQIDPSHIDTFQTKKITISNKSSSSDAYLNGIKIPKGYYRVFELKSGQWTYYNNTTNATINDPYIDDLPFGSTNYSVEKYAKDIGLIYKELNMWDYQPNPGGSGGAYKTGFGIRMSMIDHN